MAAKLTDKTQSAQKDADAQSLAAQLTQVVRS